MIEKAHIFTSENRGTLFSLETNREIPFAIKRTFFLHDLPIGAIRGNHANMNGQCVIILLAGEAKVTVDDGRDELTELLSDAGQYLCIAAGLWHKIENLKADTVLCVVASNRYDEADYESDYKEYLKKKVKYNV